MTPEDLRDAAARWLPRGRASVVIVEADVAAPSMEFPGLDVEDSGEGGVADVHDDGVIGAGPALGALGPLTLPAIDRFTHRSGLDVLLLSDDDLPTVSQRLVFWGGPLVEPEEVRGVASTTAWSLLGGARNDRKRETTRQVHGRTLGLAAINGESYTGLTFQARSTDYAPLMQGFAEIVIRPALTEGGVATMVRQKYGTLQRNEAVPRFLAWQQFRRVLFRGHPAEIGPTGWIGSIPRIDGREAWFFHRRWWLPKNGTLFLSGDVDRAELEPVLDSALKRWRKKKPKIRPREAPRYEGGRIVLINKPGLSQSQLYVGGLGPASGSADLAATEVLSRVLGGGLGARLNRRLRIEKQITYGAGSSLLVLPDTGALFAWASVDAEATGECVREILAIFEQVRSTDPPGAAEVERAVAGLEGSLLRSFMTNHGSTATLLRLLAWGQDPTDPAAWIEKLRAVGPDDVAAAAARQLDPGALTFVVLGDAAAIEPEVADLGFEIEVIHAPR